MPPSKVLINAVSAKMGGAANYLHAVLPELHRRALPFEVLVCVPPEQQAALQARVPGFRVFAPPAEAVAGAAARLRFDQLGLRRVLREERVDLLFSTANFAMLAAPCRQVLLVRNALFFSALYLATILPEKPVRVQLVEAAKRELARVSVRAADAVLAPSRALAREMEEAGAGHVEVVPYGVDRTRFSGDGSTRGRRGSARLLFTSLWAEHKNLETLLRALVQLRAGGVPATLVTTASPLIEAERGAAHRRDRALAADLERRGGVTFLPERSGAEVTALYAEADVFVYPSVVESFGHPLLEAMASGLPVVAADVPINRELCGDAAVYFSPFDATACARAIAEVLEDATLRTTLVTGGLARVERFTWSGHVDALLAAISGSSHGPVAER